MIRKEPKKNLRFWMQDGWGDLETEWKRAAPKSASGKFFEAEGVCFHFSFGVD